MSDLIRHNNPPFLYDKFLKIKSIIIRDTIADNHDIKLQLMKQLSDLYGGL